MIEFRRITLGGGRSNIRSEIGSTTMYDLKPWLQTLILPYLITASRPLSRPFSAFASRFLVLRLALKTLSWNWNKRMGRDVLVFYYLSQTISWGKLTFSASFEHANEIFRKWPIIGKTWWQKPTSHKCRNPVFFNVTLSAKYVTPKLLAESEERTKRATKEGRFVNDCKLQ